ncbi:SDR family oxidoreductase [Agromyces sp. ZXT2-6]
MRRLGMPEDVAWDCVYLASDESTRVTGVNLPIGGGFMAR